MGGYWILWDNTFQWVDFPRQYFDLGGYLMVAWNYIDQAKTEEKGIVNQVVS